MLVHVSTRVFFLRVIDVLVQGALQGSIAAGGVGVQPTARLHSEIRGLLYGLHGAISGRLDDDRTLAADPRDHGWPVFVIMATAGLTFRAATTGSAPQRLLASMCRLAFLTRGVIEVIRFNRALSRTLHRIGERRIA